MASYGLKKKPTLNELADRIENEPNTIKYPDRTATIVRNSFELSQLDGEGMREMEQQQAQQMAEVAKENAIRNLAKNSDMNHADLSEKAKAATRSVGVQKMLKTIDKGTQKAPTTQTAETQDTTQQASSSSQTQHFDISQGDQPHVEDRSARRLEQENEALLRKQLETQMVEERQRRLLTEQFDQLNSLAREKETQEYELIEVLKRAQHQELQHAARLASQESQAEAMIRKQSQEHARELRKERFRTPSPKTRRSMLKHPTTPTGTPSPQKEARTEEVNNPNISPINPVALPPPPPRNLVGQAKAKATPKAEAKPKGRPPKPSSGDTGAASSSATPATAEPPAETGATVQKGIEKIEGKSRAWWSRQNITTIKTQAELRGHRFMDLDTKGGKVKKDGTFVKQKRFSKQVYLEVLYKLLNI